MKFDIISIGDATIDTFLFLHEAQVKCTIKSEECELCFPYGEKLPVQSLHRTVAGNACNNAIANARFGFKNAFVVSVGEDPSGNWIIDALKKEGINTAFVKKDKKTQTNASTVLSFKGERTIFVYHSPRVYALPPKMPKAKAVYYTSVGLNHEKLNNQVAAYVKKTGARLGFNPGTYQMNAGLEKMRSVLAVTEMLFINKQEAARILAVHGSIAEHARLFHNLGVRTVIITDGANGAFVSDSQQMYFLGVPKTKVVERTGAGDSFAAGFMAARLQGKSIPEAMRIGSANASSVIMHIGPQTGLLSMAQIKNFIKKYKIGTPHLVK